jgi:hypothetical protein
MVVRPVHWSMLRMGQPDLRETFLFVIGVLTEPTRGTQRESSGPSSVSAKRLSVASASFIALDKKRRRSVPVFEGCVLRVYRLPIVVEADDCEEARREIERV